MPVVRRVPFPTSLPARCLRSAVGPCAAELGGGRSGSYASVTAVAYSWFAKLGWSPPLQGFRSGSSETRIRGEHVVHVVPHIGKSYTCRSRLGSCICLQEQGIIFLYSFLNCVAICDAIPA